MPMLKRRPTRAADPPFVAASRYEIAALEDRCAPRQKVKIPAKLRRSGARGSYTVVHDLSLAGFCSSSPARMHVGTICWLTLPGLEALQAEVIWWQGGMVGCGFAKLLSPIIHEHILARYAADDDEVAEKLEIDQHKVKFRLPSPA
jgi:hypothetical protein